MKVPPGLHGKNTYETKVCRSLLWPETTAVEKFRRGNLCPKVVTVYFWLWPQLCVISQNKIKPLKWIFAVSELNSHFM